jgi:hypothetical protein
MDNDTNMNKRKRGKKYKSNSDQNVGLSSLEITIKNRLFTKALFDTDIEVTEFSYLLLLLLLLKFQ